MFSSIPPLSKKENIGRGVFSSRIAKKARNKLPIPEAFQERMTADRISVDRLDLASLEKFIESGNRIAKNRSNGKRRFYGWAVLSVEQAECEDRKVEATPIEDNPYHADICMLNLPDDETRVDAQYDHAVELAAEAKWLDVNS